MSTQTVERAADWENHPFAGGYAGLHDLADEEFSGMVTAGPSRLFMLRGAVVGVLDGDIEDFEEAGGTAREAPHPALPLLAVMQSRADEVRAEYYTEETPIAEVDRTLSDGNFTGFIELSENVLSGDYYQVYHQGRSMSVAFVGASERLIVDDEAFEQANDEVGIYEVKPVDVEIIEIPEPEGAAAGADAAAAAATAETAGDAGGVDTDDEPATDHPASGSGDTATGDSAATGDDAVSEPSGTDDAATGGAEESGAADGEPETPAGETATSTEAADGSADAAAAGTAAEDTSSETASSTSATGASTGDEARSEPSGTDDAVTEPSAESDPAETTASASTGSSTSETPEASQPAGGSQSAPDRTDRTEPQRSGAGGQEAQGTDHPAAGGTDGDSGGALGAGDLEVRSLPSLDPAKTASASRQERAASSPSSAADADSVGATGGDPAGGESVATEGATPEAQSPDTQSAETQSPAQAEEGASTEPTQTDAAASETATSQEPGADSDELATARQEVERLETELAELEGDHEAVVAERDRLQTELSEAQKEIERLQGRLEEVGAGTEVSTSLSPREAIDETNLFIRYDSKGEATLAKAHDGDVDRTEVDENMRVEYHTSFDADDAAVDGIDFDTFLTNTVQYEFVDWLVRQLLYEIRDTGNTGPMGDLYDAIPKIDRAELNGQVGVQYTENGQEHRAQIGFDVIVRDRMGNALMVANLNDSRDPATEGMMTDLVRAAERVGESSPSLAGAFLVTESFFAPEALETAEEATAGGLLNRGKQKSFVNLSRKGGYHLCLVEARNQEFHLAVPEL